MAERCPRLSVRMGCLAGLLMMTASTGLVAGRQEPAGVKAAPAALEGVWIAQSMEANGRPMPPVVVDGVTFVFKGERLTITGLGGPAVEQQCAIVVDENAAPKRLDFTPTDGRTAYSVYEIAADGLLKINFTRGGNAASRPMALTTGPGTNQLLIVLKKKS